MSLVQLTTSQCSRDFMNHHFDEGLRQESEFLRHSSMEQATLLRTDNSLSCLTILVNPQTHLDFHWLHLTADCNKFTTKVSRDTKSPRNLLLPSSGRNSQRSCPDDRHSGLLWIARALPTRLAGVTSHGHSTGCTFPRLTTQCLSTHHFTSTQTPSPYTRQNIFTCTNSSSSFVVLKQWSAGSTGYLQSSATTSTL